MALQSGGRGKEYSESFKIRSNPGKMNSPSSFPALGYRGNAELNYQVRAPNTFLVLSTIKIPLRILQAIRGFDFWQNFSMSSFNIAKVSGSRVALGAVLKIPKSHYKKHNAKTLIWFSASWWKVLQFQSSFPLGITKLNHSPDVWGLKDSLLWSNTEGIVKWCLIDDKNCVFLAEHGL